MLLEEYNVGPGKKPQHIKNSKPSNIKLKT